MSTAVNNNSAAAILAALRGAESEILKLAKKAESVDACSFYARGGRWIVEPPRDLVLQFLRIAEFAVLQANGRLRVSFESTLGARNVIVKAIIKIADSDGGELIAREDFGEAIVTSQVSDSASGEIVEEVSETAARAATTRALKRTIEHLFPSVAAFYRDLSLWAQKNAPREGDWNERAFAVKRKAVEAYKNLNAVADTKK